MKVNYDVAIEEVVRLNGRESEESKKIREFLGGKQKNMCFEYDTADEAKSKAAIVASACKKFNKDVKKISYTKRNNKIYIVRVK